MGRVDIANAGTQPSGARAAVILIHGRGGDAHDMLSLAHALHTTDVAYISPQAPGNTWYPYSFMAPIEKNEPQLSLSLETLDQVVKQVTDEGTPPSRIVLIGFSQGACLAAEYLARKPRRFGGLGCLSGALIGPDGAERLYSGSFENMPAFFGCSDVDSHIPAYRVREAAATYTALGAQVTLRFYPGLAHTINEDEVASLRALLDSAGGTQVE